MYLIQLLAAQTPSHLWEILGWWSTSLLLTVHITRLLLRRSHAAVVASKNLEIDQTNRELIAARAELSAMAVGLDSSQVLVTQLAHRLRHATRNAMTSASDVREMANRIAASEAHQLSRADAKDVEAITSLIAPEAGSFRKRPGKMISQLRSLRDRFGLGSAPADGSKSAEHRVRRGRRRIARLNEGRA